MFSRRKAASLLVPIVLAGCAESGETVVVTSTQWVDPGTGEVAHAVESDWQQARR